MNLRTVIGLNNLSKLQFGGENKKNGVTCNPSTSSNFPLSSPAQFPGSYTPLRASKQLFYCCFLAMAAHTKPLETVITKLNGPMKERRHSKSQSAFNYDNTSSNLAASTMHNELKKLVETAPPDQREVYPRKRFQKSLRIWNLMLIFDLEISN